jgi:hypothetical protein
MGPGEENPPMGETKPRIDQRVLKSAIVGGVLIEILESRTTRWLFDRTRKCFLRLPTEVAVDASVLGLPWRAYQELDLNGRDALVTLNAAGTRRLRAAAT